MSFRSAFAAIMKSVAAAMARMPRLVLEGGKWVLRAAAAALPTPPHEEAMAEQVLMAELMRAREIVKADVAEADPREDWGRAAGDYLMPCGEPATRPKAVLDARAIAYLDSLDIEERAALLAYEAKHIGQHLMGERRLQGLPPVPTAAEFTAGEQARLAALAGPGRESRAEVRAKIAEVVDVMRDRGYEHVPAMRPRAA